MGGMLVFKAILVCTTVVLCNDDVVLLRLGDITDELYSHRFHSVDAAVRVSADLHLTNTLREYIMAPEPKTEYMQRFYELNKHKEDQELPDNSLFTFCPANMFVACGKLFKLTNDDCDRITSYYYDFAAQTTKYFEFTSTDIYPYPLSQSRVTHRTQEAIACGLTGRAKDQMYLDMVSRFSRAHGFAETQCLRVIREYHLRKLRKLLPYVIKGYCPARMFVECGAKGLNCATLVEHFYRFENALLSDDAVSPYVV
eukprot:Lankesteria_metandrocarpae@DN10485_c0_g1_i1.p1